MRFSRPPPAAEKPAASTPAKGAEPVLPTLLSLCILNYLDVAAPRLLLYAVQLRRRAREARRKEQLRLHPHLPHRKIRWAAQHS